MRHALRSALALIVGLSLSLALAPTVPGAARSATTSSPAIAVEPDNPIVVENRQTGTFGWLHGTSVSDDATGQIKGYWSATSVKQNEDITLYVTVNPAQTYTLDIYRLGWYQGTGARLRSHVGPLPGTTQSTCVPDATTGLIACNWLPSYTLTVPSDWTSGVYLGQLTNAQGYQNYVIFVVRDDRPAPFLYQQNIMTNQAYNNYPNDGRTGKSLYTYNSYGANTISGETRAVKVSFDRPYADFGSYQFDEMEFIRWMERMGYDVTYSTNVDTHQNGASLRSHKALLSVGHDEYWSKEIFDAIEGARDAGVNLAFFAADTGSVQVRFEASATGTPNRVMICYKNANIDPVYGPTTTVAFRSPPVNRPEQALRGVISGSMLNPGTPLFDYVVTNSSHWIYAGTGLKDGDTVPGIVGYEMDRYRSQYPTPNSTNWTLLSHSPFTDYQGIADYANSSIYQAPSHAWVFSSGTISWSRALDGFWYGRTDARIQQVTANLFAAFLNGAPGVQGLTLSAPGAATAGAAFNVTVTAVDSQGAPVTSYDGTVHFSSSDSGAGVQLPPDSKLTNGVGTFSVTLASVGSQTLTASDAAGSLTATATVVVSAPSTAIAFRAATQNDQAGTATSLALGVPAGVVSGDALYAVVIYEDGSTPTDPSGWTLVGEATNSGNDRTRVLRRFASSEPASYTWTFASANHVGGAMVAYSGVDRGTPDDVAPAARSGNSANPTSPSRTTLTKDAWLLSIYGTAGWGGSTSTGPSGMTVRSTFGANHSFGVADQRIASAGATGTRAWSENYATPWAALAIALRPNGTAPVAQALRISGPATATAGNAFSVTVSAVDGQGNPVSTYGGTVHFSSTDNADGVQLPPDSTLTGGQGTFNVALITAGAQMVTASDAASSLSASATVAVTARAANHLALATTASPGSGTSFPFTVTALDDFGNTDTAYAGTVRFTSSDASPGVVLPPNSKLTSGQGTFAATLVSVGSQTITGTDVATAAITGTLTVSVAATVHDLRVTAPMTATAGAPFSVTVVAADAQGNPVPGYGGTVHFASSDASPGVSLPSDSTLTNGQGTFSVKLTKAGPQTVTVSDVQSSLSTTVGVSVTAQQASRLVLSTETSTPTAGTSLSLTVVAQDQFANTDLAYAGRVHFTSTDGSATAVLPADSTLTNGQGTFSVTLTKAGAQTITATDTVTAAITGNVAVTVQPADAASLTLEAPSGARAGQSFSVKVTLTDQFGNVASGYRGTVHFSSSDMLPTVVLPADYRFTGADAGVHSFSVTLWTVGGQTVTARDTANTALSATRSASVSLL